MKICIVGGVAGGASAATRLRRLSEDADIVLFEKGDYISYANCGLPYYIGGAIQEKDALLVTKPDLLRNRFRIDVRTENEVLAIHRAEKELQVKNLRTGEVYTESYDKLILSPGAEPKRPPLPGIDLDGVFTLRTVTDMERIDAYLKGRSASRAVVVGGGFIGVEMAENLQRRGLDVTIVEFADQVVASLDPEMAQILHRHLTEHGVSLRLKTGLAGIAQVDTGLQVELSDGSAIESDLVLLSIGVSPENKLAKEAGLQVCLDMASYNIVEGDLEFFDILITKYVDIVFANEEEAKAYTGKDAWGAINEIASKCSVVIVKLGAQGSCIKKGTECIKLEVPPVKKVVDTTGAGDYYAAGFLYGLTCGYSLEKCSIIGSILASNVIQVVGTTLSKKKWDEIKLNIEALLQA